MKLFYYKENNFGDKLNPWLWNKLIPGIIDDDDSTAFIGIGTLLNNRLNDKVKNSRLRVIFGSGAGYGDSKLLIDDSYKIYCVRGPLSAQTLEISPELAVTDAAILIRKVFNESSKKLYKFSYVPHYEMAGEGWRLVCERLGFGYIDPRSSIEEVISCVSQSEVILAEAMHGAIIADSLRVPWIPVVSNSTILSFKWQDWCQSIDVEYQPSYIKRLQHPRQKLDILSPLRFTRDWFRQQEAASQLLKISQTARPSISSDKKIEYLTEEMYQKILNFKEDVNNGVFLTP